MSRVLVVNLFYFGILIRLACVELLVVFRRRSGDEPHLLLERSELRVCGSRTSGRLESFEVARETIARKFFVDLDVRANLTLVLVDLLFHSRKRLKRGFLGNRRHRLGDALLRVCPSLLREKKILLARCFFDVVVETAQRFLQAVCLLLVRFPRELHLRAARYMLTTPHE